MNLYDYQQLALLLYSFLIVHSSQAVSSSSSIYIKRKETAASEWVFRMEQNDKKTILVAVDESEESMYALSWCLHNLLQQQHADQNAKYDVVLLYVKPPPPLYLSLDAAGEHNTIDPGVHIHPN